MSEPLRIAPMTHGDLEVALDWAAAEGWNPGLDDASAFHAVDPAGFLMGWLGEAPIAAISVVRHGPGFGFLGFYLCREAFRGQGHGLALWRAGMDRLDGLCVGLDGVVAQQDNYRRSGFVFVHETRRHEGVVRARAHAGIEAATPADLRALAALDTEIQGVARAAYASAWFGQSPHRQTLVKRAAGAIVAAATIRTCRNGHKIGPLIAPDAEHAEALIESLAAHTGATRIALDVPEPNRAGVALAEQLDLVSAFACARMYRGTPPERALERIFGETTFELG
ncbi:MAG: GNAT family N-acetyltransferase [Pseudomonadota bacterium]